MLTYFLHSLDLSLKTLCFSITIGITLGFLSFRYVVLKRILFFCYMVAISIPKMVVALMLQILFANYFPMLPMSGYGTFKHTILPVISLSVVPIFVVSRMFYLSLSSVSSKEYIQFAKIKGLTNREIFWRHMFKNAIAPVVAYSGRLFSNILTNAILIEQIFLIPGLGSMFMDTFRARDYVQLSKLLLVYYLIVNILFWIKEYIYYVCNPKIGMDQ